MRAIECFALVVPACTDLHWTSKIGSVELICCSYTVMPGRRRWSVAARRGGRLQPSYPSPNVRASQLRHGFARPRMSACAYTTNCRPRCQHVLHAGNAAAFRVSHPLGAWPDGPAPGGLRWDAPAGAKGAWPRASRLEPARSRPDCPACIRSDCCFRLFAVHRCAPGCRMGRQRPQLDAGGPCGGRGRR